MNIETRKTTSTKEQEGLPWIQATRPVLSRRGVGHERCGGKVSGRGSVCTVRSRTSKSGKRSMTVVEEDGNQAKVEGEGIVSAGTGDL